MLKSGVQLSDIRLRVGYYGRVSTEKDEQRMSIDNQQTFFENFIADRPKWIFVGSYIDDGVSGMHTEKRENFQRMINDSKNNKIDLILTKEISRFARNTLDSIQFTREMLLYGTCVWFINDNINTIDTDSEFRLTIMAGVAQDEIRKLSTRVSFGHAQSIKKGRVLGTSNMFGWTKKDCKLTIVEEEAEMIRKIFELYATGDYSTKSIETYLYEHGYRGRTGKKIGSNTIKHIITNPKYKGYYCGGKVKVIDMFTKKQEFLPKEEWTMFKDETGETVPAIVSEEIWNRANEIYEKRSEIVKSRRTSMKNENNIFTGKIYCGVDGATYWLKSRSIRGKQDMKWRCSHKIKEGAKSCPSFSIDEEDLKIMLSDIINSLFKEFDDMYDTYIENFKKSVSNINDGNDVKIERLQKELEDEQNKKNKLLDLLLSDLVTKSDFKEKTNQINNKIDQLQEELNELILNCNEDDDFEKRLRKVREMLLKFNGVTSSDINKKIVDDVVKKIVICPCGKDTATISFFLNDGNERSNDVIFSKESSKYGQNSMCRSGHVLNNLLPERHIEFSRNLRSCVDHKLIIKYAYAAFL